MKKSSVVVVVLIAVTAVGLCIPAVQSMNETALRTQCVNNLKQISLATHNYYDSHRLLPRAIASTLTPDFPPEKQISWLWLISPYVEARMDPKFRMNVEKSWDDPENNYVVTSSYLVFLCPANTNHGEHVSFSSYVGITGVGKDAAWLPLFDPKAGIFGYERSISLKDITDGTSNTIMIAETGKDNGPWAIGGYTTARGLEPDESGYSGQDGQFGSFHRQPSLFSYKSKTMVAMADASVRGFKNDVSNDVFEALATYAGGEKMRVEDLD